MRRAALRATGTAIGVAAFVLNITAALLLGLGQEPITVPSWWEMDASELPEEASL